MADLTTKAINTYGLNDETLGLGHKILIVGDSAEYLTLVSDIAKKIVEDYAGSTLFGSVQSVKSVFDYAQGHFWNYSGIFTQAIASGDDLNNYVNIGEYGANQNSIATSLSNCPATKAFRMVVEDLTPATGESTRYRYRRQRLVEMDDKAGIEWMRRISSSDTGATWSYQDWVKTPTRTEIDKISDINGIFSTNLAISGSSSEQYTVPNDSQHLVILHGASITIHGLYLVAASPNGVMYSTEITKGTNLTVTTPSNNTLQIANAFTNGCYFTDICLRGSAITKVTAGTNSAQSESI